MKLHINYFNVVFNYLFVHKTEFVCIFLQPNTYKCDFQAELNQVTCSIGNPLGHGIAKELSIRMDPSKISPTTREMIFQLRVNT